MAEKKHFRDFHLLVLDHPSRSEEAFSKGKRNVDTKLKYGEESILRNTKHGDVILIEASGRSGLKDYMLYWGWKKRALKDRFEEVMREEWETGENRKWNFYANLAKLAEEHGRKVISLDPGSVKPGGRLFRLAGALDEITEAGYERKVEVREAMRSGRTRSQIVRIDNHKPKMVVAASMHGAVFEQEMRPRSVEWYKPLNPEEKRDVLYLYRVKIETMNKLRKKRRQRINERLMQEGKLPRMRAKQQAKRKISPK